MLTPSLLTFKATACGNLARESRDGVLAEVADWLPPNGRSRLRRGMLCSLGRESGVLGVCKDCAFARVVRTTEASPPKKLKR